MLARARHTRQVLTKEISTLSNDAYQPVNSKTLADLNKANDQAWTQGNYGMGSQPNQDDAAVAQPQLQETGADDASRPDWERADHFFRTKLRNEGYAAAYKETVELYGAETAKQVSAAHGDAAQEVEDNNLSQGARHTLNSKHTFRGF
jgi:hypothetical protein